MFRSKNPIGVDIGSHTVKVCQLKRIGDTYELEGYGIEEIYPGGEPSGDPVEQRRMKSEALKRALEKGQIKAKTAVSAVSGESIIVRYLQLPEMPEEELKKALQWEAEEYIPFRLSEVNIDSQILGHVADGDHPKMDVLLVSAKKDLVEDHVQIIRAAGLEPAVVDVESFAFLNCFEVNHTPGSEDCVALVNIGGAVTNINIFNRGVSRFSRDILNGGDTMTQAIKSRMSCSWSEAERLKISHGLPQIAPVDQDKESTLTGSLMSTISNTVDEMTAGESGGKEQTPEAKIRTAIQHTVHSLFSEIRRSIEFFESQYRGLSVNRVVLGGGTAMLRNLQENLARELGLAVELIDPLRKVRVSARQSGDVERLGSLRHQLGVGIGLGIRGMAA